MLEDVVANKRPRMKRTRDFRGAGIGKTSGAFLRDGSAAATIDARNTSPPGSACLLQVGALPAFQPQYGAST